MNPKHNNYAFYICASGIMSALIFVATYMRVDVPLGPSVSMVSFGNVLCILSGLLFPPLMAGLSSGIGSFVFDLVAPGYLLSAPFTFFSKFIMAFICSKFLSKRANMNSSRKINFLAALSGILVFTILRIIKIFLHNYLVLRLELPINIIMVVKSIATSLINSVIALLFAIPLALILKKSLSKIGYDSLLNTRAKPK
ncbi:MAG: ECF transporter S component [Oscillospiraceae bacterium]|nr:ECF transporter S component [Oscillospiraceae bacterium]